MNALDFVTIQADIKFMQIMPIRFYFFVFQIVGSFKFLTNLKIGIQELPKLYESNKYRVDSTYL